MKRKKERVWKEYFNSLAVAFGIAAIFAFIVPIKVDSNQSLPIDLRLWLGFLSGTVFGHAFFIVGYFLPRVRFPSFLLTCLVRSLIICFTMVVGLLVVVPLSIAGMARPILAPWNPLVLARFREAFPPASILNWTLIGLGMSIVINAAYQINRKLGPWVAWHWITGKYHTAREEERIFMFLDLKNSTTLAERMGNKRFSNLCKDFFDDLSSPLTKTSGTVSHYIGDEAVLTWKPQKGLDKAKCLQCFLLMQEAIQERAAHYRKEYGIVPEFKAGVHIGQVVAVEVGDIKSEICYYGDVLNTTARITGLCNELACDLLISGELLARLPDLPSGLAARSFGPRLLKGKEHEVEIVAMSPIDDPAQASNDDSDARLEKSNLPQTRL
ncbi:MAG TPA: adenylate/guanylate cyclase domain-containing protein [Fimbriimonadaceae bacterium]|nr:adenylate/guanylate cyclase domain-containing protein [Fimbriimonadaceae bacterium]